MEYITTSTKKLEILSPYYNKYYYKQKNRNKKKEKNATNNENRELQ